MRKIGTTLINTTCAKFLPHCLKLFPQVFESPKLSSRIDRFLGISKHFINVKLDLEFSAHSFLVRL